MNEVNRTLDSRVSIEYRLRFEEGRPMEHVVHVDAIQPRRKKNQEQERDLPEWTRLENSKCSNCPLASTGDSHCPAAARLAPLVEQLHERPSDAPVCLEVRTVERTVTTATSLQRAMSSLFGLVIASSDCPHTKFLLPMARYHLPLSSESETVYRVASMHLLGQHLRRRGGEEVSGGLEDLAERYRQLAMVNRGLAARLREAGKDKEEVSVNAVILLDLLARIVPSNIEDDLDDLGRWYGAARESEA